MTYPKETTRAGCRYLILWRCDRQQQSSSSCHCVILRLVAHVSGSRMFEVAVSSISGSPDRTYLVLDDPARSIAGWIILL